MHPRLRLGTLSPAFADLTIMADPSDTSPHYLTANTLELFEDDFWSTIDVYDDCSILQTDCVNPLVDPLRIQLGPSPDY